MSAHGDHDMGHTVAGWTGTAIATMGTAIMGVAFAAGSPAGLWSGGAVVVLAVLTTWGLHLAGWGKASGPRPPGRRHWRIRDTAAGQGHPGCVGCRMAGRGTRGRADGTAAAPARLDTAPVNATATTATATAKQTV